MSSTNNKPHVALFPTAGMGHLIPHLRLAAMLASRNCNITFITVHPTVSTAESSLLSSFFASFPHINRLEFEPLPYKPSGYANTDPFFIQFEAIGNSTHLLRPILSSLSPPLSAIFADFPTVSSVSQIAADLSIPTYVLIVTSARFFSLMASIRHLSPAKKSKNAAHVEIPGLSPVPVSSIPPPMLDQNHFMAANVSSNALSLSKLKGILVNTFDSFEPQTIEALNSGKVVPDLAPVIPIGPLESFQLRLDPHLAWLDKQAPVSVVFVCLGSRDALSKNQLRQLASGLEKTGAAFFWVLKTTIVEKNDKDQIQEILGKAFIERTKNKGIVIKEWVDQDQILAHPAVGGFVSHGGWNSVMEAAKLGVPALVWAAPGDQRVNAEVMEKAGLGLWPGHWKWGGDEVVNSDEIAERISEIMHGEVLRAKVKEIKKEAENARKIDGTSERLLQGIIQELQIKQGY